MALLDRLRRFAPGVLLALGLAASGCSGSSDEESAASDDAITNIDNTKVKHQVIGNCWLYATVGWVEALHLKATAEKLDLSESYLTYWRWFDVLGTSPDVASAAAAVNDGGTWELASELIRRYGLMAETDSLPSRAFRCSRAVATRPR